MRRSYHDMSATVYYYCLIWNQSIENKYLTVKDFARKIGSTDPTVASEDSLRGLLFANRYALGLRSRPSRENNFVHASKSAYEALVEKNRWTDLVVRDEPLCARLISAGIPEEKLLWWATNPRLVGENIPSAMKGKRASDLMKENGINEAFNASLSVLEKKLNTGRS